jgi:hypothetical protein
LEKKEKVTMRKSFTTAAALVLVLTVASPAVAAPRNQDRTEPPAFSVIIKKLVKKVFGITSNADITIPIPKQ